MAECFHNPPGKKFADYLKPTPYPDDHRSLLTLIGSDKPQPINSRRLIRIVEHLFQYNKSKPGQIFIPYEKDELTRSDTLAIRTLARFITGLSDALTYNTTILPRKERIYPEGQEGIYPTAGIDMFFIPRPSTKEGVADFRLPDELVAAMAIGVLNFLYVDSARLLNLDPETAAEIVYGDKEATLSTEQYAAMQDYGIPLYYIAQRLGTDIRRIAGFSIDRNPNFIQDSEPMKKYYRENFNNEKLDTSIGMFALVAVAGMQDAFGNSPIIISAQPQIIVDESAEGKPAISRGYDTYTVKIEGFEDFSPEADPIAPRRILPDHLKNIFVPLFSQNKVEGSFTYTQLARLITGGNTTLNSFYIDPDEMGSIPRRVRGSVSSINERTRRHIEKLNNHPTTYIEPVGDLFRLLNADVRNLLAEMPERTGATEDYIVTVEGQRLKKERDLQFLSDFTMSPFDTIYFEHDFQNQYRIFMNSSTIDPLGSKIHRPFFVAGNNQALSMDQSSSADMQNFALVLAAALGHSYETTDIERPIYDIDTHVVGLRTGEIKNLYLAHAVDGYDSYTKGREGRAEARKEARDTYLQKIIDVNASILGDPFNPEGLPKEAPKEAKDARKEYDDAIERINKPIREAAQQVNDAITNLLLDNNFSGLFSPDSMHLLSAIVSLSSFRNSFKEDDGAFENYIQIQGDSTSSGYAIAVGQFMTSDAGIDLANFTAKDILNRVGIFNKRKGAYKSFAAYKKKGLDDTYQSVARIASDDFRRDNLLEAFEHIMGTLTSSSVTNEIEKGLRELIKYPFMYNTYSAGIPRIMIGIRKGIREDIAKKIQTLAIAYAKVSEMEDKKEKKAARKRLAPQRSDLIGALKVIYGKRFIKDTDIEQKIIDAKKGEPIEVNLLEFDKRLEKKVMNTFRVPIKKSFEATLGTQASNRNTLTFVQEAAYHIYYQLVQDRINKKYPGAIAETSRGNISYKLTQQQFDEIREELRREDIFFGINQIGNTPKEREANNYILELSKSRRLPSSIKAEVHLNNYPVTVPGTEEEFYREVSSLSSELYIYTLASPEASGGVRPIHHIDSAIMRDGHYDKGRKLDIFGFYDAAYGFPNEVRIAADNMNRSLIKHMLTYNTVEETEELFNNLYEKIKETPDLLDIAEASFLAKKPDQNKIESFDDAQEKIETLRKSVNTFRDTTLAQALIGRNRPANMSIDEYVQEAINENNIDNVYINPLVDSFDDLMDLKPEVPVDSSDAPVPPPGENNLPDEDDDGSNINEADLGYSLDEISNEAAEKAAAPYFSSRINTSDNDPVNKYISKLFSQIKRNIENGEEFPLAFLAYHSISAKEEYNTPDYQTALDSVIQMLHSKLIKC